MGELQRLELVIEASASVTPANPDDKEQDR